MGKKDPKIIRVGDVVEVINPQIFIRCGYPLSFDAAVDKVKDVYGAKIRDFMLNIEGLKDNSSIPDLSLVEGIKSTNKTFTKIATALTYDYMRSKGFGGANRKIYTKKKDHIDRQMLIVENVRFVKTGVYVSGSSYPSYYDEYAEYDPPYLADVKTHKILGVSNISVSQYEDRIEHLLMPYNEKKNYWWDYEIEAINVKKHIKED